MGPCWLGGVDREIECGCLSEGWWNRIHACPPSSRAVFEIIVIVGGPIETIQNAERAGVPCSPSA